MELPTGGIDPDDVAAINEIAAFLALSDFSQGPAQALPKVENADCIVLAGNSVLHTAESAFKLARMDSRRILLISGGVGHSTHRLCEEVKKHHLYSRIPTSNRAEANILSDVARQYWSVDPNRIIVEQVSTNCGENARFSRRALDARGIDPQHIVLIQDPTMPRRTDASFRQIWLDHPKVKFLNWPTFTPRVKIERNDLVFDLGPLAGLWPMDRFLSLLMGEIPRLRNDPNGYGPNGRGFIVALDIPDEVETAYRRLAGGLCAAFGVRAPVPAV